MYIRRSVWYDCVIANERRKDEAMLKLELDWASDDAPVTGTGSSSDDVTLVVAYDATPGPAGWCVVSVYAQRRGPWVEAYREAQALDAWVRDVYGVEDDEEREELVSLAVEV